MAPQASQHERGLPVACLCGRISSGGNKNFHTFRPALSGSNMQGGHPIGLRINRKTMADQSPGNA